MELSNIYESALSDNTIEVTRRDAHAQTVLAVLNQKKGTAVSVALSRIDELRLARDILNRHGYEPTERTVTQVRAAYTDDELVMGAVERIFGLLRPLERDADEQANLESDALAFANLVNRESRTVFAGSASRDYWIDRLRATRKSTK